MAEFRGAFFSPAASLRVARAIEDGREAVAQQAYDQVQMRLGQVLRNPTGYYQSRVQVSNVGDTDKVHDSNVIYGPWLEGTGSRNSTTRFKGYATFRTIAQQTKRGVGPVFDPYISRVVRELNS